MAARRSLALCVGLALLGLTDAKMADLTHVFNSTSSHPQILRAYKLSTALNGSYGPIWVESNDIAMSEHTGTHVDAPAHTWLGGAHMQDVSLESLVSPGVVINIVHKLKNDSDALLEISDIQAFEAKYGQIPQKAFIAIDTGGYKVYWDRVAFFGTPTPENGSTMHFPGFGPEAVRWLIDERDINGVGTDRMSTDPGNTKTFPAHVVLSSRGKYGVENLNNLDRIPPVGATIAVVPLPLQGGSGAPARVMAFWDTEAPVHAGSGSVRVDLLLCGLLLFGVIMAL